MTGRALIVAHGQPSEPDPAEAALARFAAAVAAELPGWALGSATLAAPGALEAAVARMARADAGPGAPLRIFPMFMAEGWFTRVNLPRRLEQAQAASGVAVDMAQCAPFGVLPGLLPLALDGLDAALGAAGWAVEETALVLAAHGSSRSAEPRRVAEAFGQRIAAARGFALLRCGFVEEAPQLAEAAHGLSARALCLPFFAAGGGHVETDVPAALATAGFAGRLLAPLGLAPGAPALVAAALRAGALRPA